MCNAPIYDKSRVHPLTGKLIPIPCGKCLGCMIDNRTLWNSRLTYEYINQRSAMVTLTYDDYFLPYNPGAIYPTVRRSDVHRFVDNLRHYVKSLPSLPEGSTKDFKVFGVSEYGSSSTRRPHYHMLVFGLDWLYFRDIIQKKWYKGHIDIGPIMKGGVRYCLKYLDKQFGRKEDVLHETFDYGCDKPFRFISPGLGSGYFISQADNISKFGCMKIGNRFVPVPAYWKNKVMNYTLENIYSQLKSVQDRCKVYQDFAVTHGFRSYDHYMQFCRKVLETSYVKNAHKRHEAVRDISSQLPVYAYDTFQELLHEIS